MKNQPLISVIWNGNGTEVGFDSLLTQSLTDFEILLSEVPENAFSDLRVRGLGLPEGRYLLYTGPGSVYTRTALAELLETAEAAGAGLCVCGVQRETTRFVGEGEAKTPQQKLALYLRLLEKGLATSSENMLFRAGTHTDFDELFSEKLLEESVCTMSGILVSYREQAGRELPSVGAKRGAEVLSALLEKGAGA